MNDVNAGRAPSYLDPRLPAGLRWHDLPVLEASEDNLRGYGRLLSRPDEVGIEIVRWPAQGRRPVDEDSGNEGGVTEGTFVAEWKGDVLYGHNGAVGGHYLLAYAVAPELAREDHQRPPAQLLLWHCNYHPDGGQRFFPRQRQPYYVPLALPGDEVRPEHFVCFRLQGDQGLYIHPNIWHEGVFSAMGRQEFDDAQGAVHARVSVDFAREFGCLLRVPLALPAQPAG